ncbi:MAG: cytochrome-c peroxidase [Acidobacteria bacterium]|nr:cytochrome-c peroxidase [Acidobacteriota bacterium]
MEFTPEERKALLALSPLPPPPKSATNRVAENPLAARLGQFLFFDTRLSSAGDLSCATCHDPAKGWSDGREVAKGKSETTRHTQSVLNAAYQRWLFWDGRADSLWAQAGKPIEDPREMAGSRLRTARVVAQDRALRKAYEKLFGALPAFLAQTEGDGRPRPGDGRPRPGDGRPVPLEPGHPHAVAWAGLAERDREAVDRVYANVGKALDAFQRLVTSRPAPFDTFVAGLRANDAAQIAALGASAQRGARIFAGRGGCTLCHSGPLLSDREFHNIGLGPRSGLPLDAGRLPGIELVRGDPFNGRGRFSDDRGARENEKLDFVAAKPESIGEFRTPSLRDVARSAPYMHDGRFARLKDVVIFYSTLPDLAAVGHREETLKRLRLSGAEVDDLVAFLESLTGEDLPAYLKSQPSSLASP